MALKETTLSVSQEYFNFIMLPIFMLGSCQEYRVQMFLLKGMYFLSVRNSPMDSRTNCGHMESSNV